MTVWGRNKERLCPALEKGAIACLSPADLAASCDAVFLCVTDSDAVEQIVFAAEGIASSALPENYLCTIQQFILNSAGSWRSACVLKGECAGWMRRFLAERAERSLVPYPFSRGEEATSTWTRHGPWMAAYGSNITHMGPQGFGQATKSCNQAILFATIAAWAEVLGYADRFGLDPTKMADALAGGFSRWSFARSMCPS